MFNGTKGRLELEVVESVRLVTSCHGYPWLIPIYRPTALGKKR